MVIDTTASFTGVEPRFTVLFAAQVGLLALIVRTADRSQLAAEDRNEDGLALPRDRPAAGSALAALSGARPLRPEPPQLGSASRT